MMDVGTKVRLSRDVERFPHFVAEEGRTGTITHLDDDGIVVELDEPLAGAEEWENCIHWSSGMFKDNSFERVFEKDVELMG